MMRPHITYGKRSRHDAVDWLCECNTLNERVHKLIFDIPTFVCPNCMRKYLDFHNFDFCLADVIVNGENLVKKVMHQGCKPECMPFAICQVMQIMHTVGCLLKKEEPDSRKLNLDPANLYRWYYKKYPHMKAGCEALGIVPSGIHKFVRITQRLRKRGIKIGNGEYYRIGAVCTIPYNFERMCAELADGIPLLAVFIPGISFGGLEYCRMYFPADRNETNKCNKKPEPHKTHSAHMVVLIGPASRIDVRGFFFINSHGEIWCPRKVLEEMLLPCIARPVRCGVGCWLSSAVLEASGTVKGGIGKVHETGLIWNVVKFYRFGETGSEEQLEEEQLEDEEDEDCKYKTSDYNFRLILY